MQIKKIVIIFLFIAPTCTQASFLSWLSPQEWNAKNSIFAWAFKKAKPSFDQLIDQEIEKREKEKFTIPSHTSCPQQFFIDRDKRTREKYSEELRKQKSIILNDPQYNNLNPQEKLRIAIQSANKAHQDIIENFSRATWESTRLPIPLEPQANFSLSRIMLAKSFEQQRTKLQEQQEKENLLRQQSHATEILAIAIHQEIARQRRHALETADRLIKNHNRKLDIQSHNSYTKQMYKHKATRN